MPNLVEIMKDAMNLDVRERAALAERLLASLEEELSEEEAERLWAEEAQRRLDEYHANVPQADTVHTKVEKLLR
jgi:putative addiction module component (TIGR02574 family)